MQCEEYQVSIQRYLDNDLSETEEKDLFEHMEQCSLCKKEFDDYQFLHNELLALPKVEIDTSCIDDILKRIDLQGNPSIEYLNKAQVNTDDGQRNLRSLILKKYKNYVTPLIAAAAILLVFFAGKGFFSSEIPNANEYGGMGIAEIHPSAEGEVAEFFTLDSPEADFRIMEKDGSFNNMADQYGIDRSLLEPIPYTQMDVRNVPAEIRSWVEKSKAVFAGQSYTYNGKTYIYVSLGKKSSSDYQVSIGEIYHHDGHLYVYTQVKEPHTIDNTNRTNVYPDLLVSVTGEYIDVHFNEWQGAEIETWIPEIFGVETIPDFYEQSSNVIKMYSPQPDSTIKDSIVIKGIARTFDGSVYYRVITDNREEIANGFILATKGAPDWGHFEQEVFIDLPQHVHSVQAYIEVFEISLRDGGQMGTVTLPITLRPIGDVRASELENKHWVTYVVRDVDVGRGLIYVDQVLVESMGIKAPNVLNLNGVPIVRDITQEKANTVSQYADISDIKRGYEIGALLTDDGKAEQVFLFE